MPLIERVFKPEVRALSRLGDAHNERYDFLRLDKNERLLPLTDGVMAEIRARLTSDIVTGYPELEPLYEKLARCLEVDRRQLFLASGSDLAIRALFEAAIAPGDELVMHQPAYGMYSVYSRMYAACARTVPVDSSTWQVDLSAMLAQVTPRTKLVVVEYPNGFVGTVPDERGLRQLAEALCARDTLLAIDGAYYYIEHTRNDLRALVADFPNVLLVQTFSKAHGLAGARLGYLVGQAPLIGEIAKTRPMHEITGPTMVAAEVLLDHPELLDDYQRELVASKAILRRELAQLGVPMRDTAANFVLLYLPDEGRTARFAARLLTHRILIRRPFTESWLAGWCRVTVGTRADSQRLIDAMRTILEQG